MESETHYKRVGLFVLVGLAFFSISLAWLSNSLVNENQKTYTIFFEKQSLDGLQKDSPVTMKGIKVGTVQDYKISGDDIQKVKVLIKIDADVPVKTDSRAAIKRNLLTGLAKIDLIGGTQSSKLITVNGKEPPIIPEEVTQFEKIADSATVVVEQIESSLSRINLILSDKNLNNIENSFSSISRITSELEKTLPYISDTAKDISELTSSINKINKKYLDENSEQNFAKKASEIADDLKNITANLKHLTEDTSPLVRSSNRSIQNIQRDISEISGSIKSFTDSYSNPHLLLNSKDLPK